MCPEEGATELSPEFQPWEPGVTRPERAPDRTSYQGGSGVRWSIVTSQWLNSIFRAATGAISISYPHLSPFKGESFILRVLLCTARATETQPRVSTLGIVHQERRALKGRQIEPPNMRETGSDGSIVTSQLLHSDFCAATGAISIWYPHLSPFRANRYFAGFPGLKLWVEFSSPFGAGPRSTNRAQS